MPTYTSYGGPGTTILEGVIQGTVGAKSVTFAPGNPSGTSSTTAVMCGVGSTVVITPIKSGIVEIILTCNAQNTGLSAASTGIGQLAYGTGTAPINGAAGTGTVCGSVLYTDESTASGYIPMTFAALITVTVGTQIWIDLQQYVTGVGTITYTNMTFIVKELLY